MLLQGRGFTGEEFSLSDGRRCLDKVELVESTAYDQVKSNWGAVSLSGGGLHSLSLSIRTKKCYIVNLVFWYNKHFHTFRRWCASTGRICNAMIPLSLGGNLEEDLINDNFFSDLKEEFDLKKNWKVFLTDAEVADQFKWRNAWKLSKNLLLHHHCHHHHYHHHPHDHDHHHN